MTKLIINLLAYLFIFLLIVLIISCIVNINAVQEFFSNWEQINNWFELHPVIKTCTAIVIISVFIWVCYVLIDRVGNDNDYKEFDENN